MELGLAVSLMFTLSQRKVVFVCLFLRVAFLFLDKTLVKCAPRKDRLFVCFFYLFFSRFFLFFFFLPFPLMFFPFIFCASKKIDAFLFVCERFMFCLSYFFFFFQLGCELSCSLLRNQSFSNSTNSVIAQGA